MIRAALALALVAGAAAASPEIPPDTQVVWLGEIHDNPGHHDTQATLTAKFAPDALVFEMLSPGQVKDAAGVDRTDADALEEAFAWADGGWPDFAMYAPIFAAVPDAALYGSARPPAATSRAVQVGALAVFGADGARFGLDASLPPDERAAREAGQAAAHCDALPPDLLPGMVEAQRLRDADLAAAALRALDDGADRVVVIAGSGHVRPDHGAPTLLALADPDVRQAVVWQGEDGAAPPDWDAAIPVSTISAPAPERGDPCAAFR
ncbi:ChaN family lipoprotein [Jannaschia sp. LMIT008]|uniref:ChaN family lipoprotein n=1 Tax=Jannaschia maritima TaxID=3032585 RepID=UPI002810B17D|nr:ChaN family lipoprotein [Jannaschia sp. LMIT008]